MTKSAINGELASKIESVLARQNSAIVSVDGRCGSGKTFFANKLSEAYSASVIRCDDFFLPLCMRTEERLALFYGNIHYERLKEVLEKVKSKKDFVYRRYDCKTGSFADVPYRFTPVTVVEGSYSQNPELKKFYDVNVLTVADEKTRKKRLEKREKENYVNFVNKWIPLEERYFSVNGFSDCIVVNLTDEGEK